MEWFRALRTLPGRRLVNKIKDQPVEPLYSKTMKEAIADGWPASSDNPIRGMLFALLFAVPLWVLIIWAIIEFLW